MNLVFESKKKKTSFISFEARFYQFLDKLGFSTAKPSLSKTMTIESIDLVFRIDGLSIQKQKTKTKHPPPKKTVLFEFVIVFDKLSLSTDKPGLSAFYLLF